MGHGPLLKVVSVATVEERPEKPIKLTEEVKDKREVSKILLSMRPSIKYGNKRVQGLCNAQKSCTRDGFESNEVLHGVFNSMLAKPTQDAIGVLANPIVRCGALFSKSSMIKSFTLRSS